MRKRRRGHLSVITMPLIEEEWTSSDEEAEKRDDEEASVELGFAVSFEDFGDGDEDGGRRRWKVWNMGKIGGRPAWLDAGNLPSPETLTCTHCNEPLLFLAQIYAPIDEMEHAYHRVLYFFCCRKAVCIRKAKGGAGAVKVLRCQLPKVNSLYEIPKDMNDGEACDEEDEDALEAIERKNELEIRRLAKEAEVKTSEATCNARKLKDLGNRAFEQEKWDEAIEQYTKAADVLNSVVSKSPYRTSKSCAEAVDVLCALHSNRCQALMRAKRPKDALRDAERAFSMRPEWPKANYRLAKALKASGEIERAKLWTRVYESVSKATNARATSPFILPEFTLECESELDVLESFEAETDESGTASSATLDDALATAAESGGAIDITERDIREALGPKSSDGDKMTIAFHKRIRCAPSQCLRYCRWPEIGSKNATLWPSEERRLPETFEPPPCERCGAARCFETQLMPQMLNHVSLGTEGGSADWETISVFTCTKCCVLKGSSFAQEFSWAQTSRKNFLC